MNRRIFKRIKLNRKVGYDFVKWDEKKQDKLDKPLYTESFNISASGIGLTSLDKLDKNMINSLITGKKKIRLAVYLEEDSNPIIVFGRLVWTGVVAKNTNGNEKCGLMFIDITQHNFLLLENYINKLIIENPDLEVKVY